MQQLYIFYEGRTHLNYIRTKIIIRRFIELFITNAACSAIITFLNATDMLVEKYTLITALFVGMAVFFIINFNMLRRCYYDLRNKQLYYQTNITAYILFVILGYFIYFICPNETYTWLFSTTKIIRFANMEFATHYSALVYYLICSVVVFLAPMGMGWIFFFDEDDEDE